MFPSPNRKARQIRRPICFWWSRLKCMRSGADGEQGIITSGPPSKFSPPNGKWNLKCLPQSISTSPITTTLEFPSIAKKTEIKQSVTIYCSNAKKITPIRTIEPEQKELKRALLSTYDATATNFSHFHTLRRLAEECLCRLSWLRQIFPPRKMWRKEPAQFLSNAFHGRSPPPPGPLLSRCTQQNSQI